MLCKIGLPMSQRYGSNVYPKVTLHLRVIVPIIICGTALYVRDYVDYCKVKRIICCG